MAEELPPSELGTKQYWDEYFQNELENFNDHEETGEVWFGMESVRRIVRWVTKEMSNKSTPILDVGCGNGMALLKLEEEGYTNLTGIDYSKAAIDLATSLAKDSQIKYQMANVAELESPFVLSSKFSLVLDKGTYDAVSLSPENATQNRLTYIGNVRKLLPTGGHFMITSCNWTSSELQTQYTENNKFCLKEEIPVTQFKFGGQVGQTVYCLVFQAT